MSALYIPFKGLHRAPVIPSGLRTYRIFGFGALEGLGFSGCLGVFRGFRVFGNEGMRAPYVPFKG